MNLLYSFAYDMGNKGVAAMYQTYGRTMLWVEIEEDSLWNIFVSSERNFNFLPQYLNIQGADFYREYYNNENSYAIRCYATYEQKLEIYENERTFYILDVIDEQDNLVISLLIPDFALRHDEAQNIVECLYQCLICLIYENDDFEYPSVNIRHFWRPITIEALSLIALDGNYINDGDRFDWLYKHIRSTTPYDIDLIFAHYKDDEQIFTGKNISMSVSDFISDITTSGRWIPKHNIWLWACDTGRPYGDEQYVPAQEIANTLGVEVEAPLGMIFVGESVLHTPQNPNYSYAIVDWHGTEWYNRDWYKFEPEESDRFWNFVLANDLENQEGGWAVYLPD